MSWINLLWSLLVFAACVQTLPVNTTETDDSNSSSEESDENITRHDNGTGQDLIVIKTIVYEIGILTDDSNNAYAGSNETEEEIDLSFFNPNRNGSFIDLSNIPVPLQTNVSGITITGVAPADFGTIKLLNDGTPTLNGGSFPLFPNKQVKVSHNITTSDKNKSALLLDNLSNILGLKVNKTNNESTSSTTNNEHLIKIISTTVTPNHDTNTNSSRSDKISESSKEIVA